MNKVEDNKVLGLYTLRTIVILIGIWILKLILVSLQFIKDLEIPGFILSISEVVNIVIIFVTLIFLIAYSINLEKLWSQEFPKVPEAGTVVSMFVFLIVLTISYGTIKELLNTFVAEMEPLLILQIVFLLLSILLLTRAAIVVYKSLPKWLSNLKEYISEPPK